MHDRLLVRIRFPGLLRRLGDLILGIGGHLFTEHARVFCLGELLIELLECRNQILSGLNRTKVHIPSSIILVRYALATHIEVRHGVLLFRTLFSSIRQWEKETLLKRYDADLRCSRTVR